MVSITIWNFIASSLGESCYTMINAGGMIKAVDMPILIHVMRMVQRNLIIFVHNMAIVPIVWLIFPWRIGFDALLCLPGLAIVYVFVVSASVITSMVCVRYRDVPPVVAAMLQLLFFVSPIIYPSSLVPEEWRWLPALNPLTGIIESFRASLFGRELPWLALAYSTAFTLVMLVYSSYAFRRMERSFAELI